MHAKDWEMRRERADKVHTLLDGKASRRVVLLIARAYLYRDLEKPLDALTDEEILAVPFLGPKTLEAIRKEIKAVTLIVVKPGENIQAAIDNAQTGDTVEVLPGEYQEGLNLPENTILQVNGPMTLRL